MKTEASELRAAMKELLAVFPMVGRSELHHGKKEYHNDDEPCPVMIRVKNAMDKALELIK